MAHAAPPDEDISARLHVHEPVTPLGDAPLEEDADGRLLVRVVGEDAGPVMARLVQDDAFDPDLVDGAHAGEKLMEAQARVKLRRP
ncbi:MAG TPA: hypothetical protein VGI39_29460 [Polyangiaceae bacterium]